MKKLIKVTALALSAALFTLPLASCGGSGDKDLPTIGIIQFAVHSSLDNCYEGLIKGLEKAGYKDGETCTIDLKNAQGDPTTADSIAGTMANKNVDMIIGIATPAAVSAYNAAGGDIPAIFCAVNDPVAVKTGAVSGKIRQQLRGKLRPAESGGPAQDDPRLPAGC